jgi:HD-like signal output (HDOD) protein
MTAPSAGRKVAPPAPLCFNGAGLATRERTTTVRTLPELIAGTTELAALPATSVRLLALLNDPEVGVEPVAAVIEKDPSLTANLLKLSNSAYYGMRRRLGTVSEALLHLGSRTVLTIAFATSMGEVMRGPMSGYRLPRRRLWSHALATGVAAARLCGPDSQAATRDRAFTAGLVHDVGKLLLDRLLQRQVEQLPPNVEAKALLIAERSLLGFDHAQAGAALGEAWNFPPDLVEAIGRHHEPPREASALVHIVAAANLVAVHIGEHAGAEVVGEDDLAEALRAAGAGIAGLDVLAGEVRRDFDGLAGILGLGA